MATTHYVVVELPDKENAEMVAEAIRGMLREDVPVTVTDAPFPSFSQPEKETE